MSPEAAEGKPIALILWRKKENGEDDLAVFKGVLTQEDGIYHLDREAGFDRVIKEARMHKEMCMEKLRDAMGNHTHARLKNFNLNWS